MNNESRTVWIVLLVMIGLLQQACGTGEYNLPTLTEVESDLVSSTITDTTSDSLEETTLTTAQPATVMARRPLSYLEEVVSPCVPIDGSDIDPCLPVKLPPVEVPSNVTTTAFTKLDSFVYMLTGTDFPLWATHIVIRGTVIPNTNRCGLYPEAFFDYYAPPESSYDSSILDSFTYFCFVEVRVNEYIVGEGPSELTVIMYRYFLYSRYPEKWPSIKELYTDASNTISRYEGKEMIMFLGPIDTRAVEAWDLLAFKRGWWFVQQKNGEPPRAVAWSIDRATTDELRSQLDLPLDELVRQIKEAAEERLVLTGGRIGVAPGLPMLVADANKLQDFYQQTGAVYEGEGATVLPPPVPGDEDPELPPTRTGEGQPDPDPPVPGEEETSPPPTDDAATTTSTGTTQPQAGETTTTTAAGPGDGETTTSTGTTRPQVEDTTTTSTAPSDEGTTTTGTTQPQAGETTTTTSTAQPRIDNGATTVPAVDVDATQPQAEETTSTTTGTTQPTDEGTTTLPQIEDAIPTPAGTTQPSAEGDAPSSDAPAPGSA